VWNGFVRDFGCSDDSIFQGWKLHEFFPNLLNYKEYDIRNLILTK
jgi:hypothetical protein